jgi:hypothetical protein
MEVTVQIPDYIASRMTDAGVDLSRRALEAPVAEEYRQGHLHKPDLRRLKSIDAGERAAIQLAVSLHADLLLMDDRKGARAAERKGLTVTGRLGVLDLAAERGLVDFDQAIKKLERTTFHRPEAPLEALLKKHALETTITELALAITDRNLRKAEAEA